MDYIIIIGAVVLFCIYLLAQNSNKETTKERYGEAVGKFADMTSDTIGGWANSLTEPADKRILRLAKEKIAEKNGHLYREEYYSEDKDTESLLEIDDSFRNALNTAGMSEELWKRVGRKLYYLGAIRKLSRDCSDYSRKNEEHTREHIVNDWPKEKYLKGHSKVLIEALDYFGIDVKEWIKYGDAVIEMHNLSQDREIREYGYYTSLLPMKNNMHLL